jgi:hypothetical protein
MAVHIPFEREIFRPTNDQVPGNESDQNPLEFDLVPAEGPDLVRLKSIIYATLGLVQTAEWTEKMQEEVIGAFKTGQGLFTNTVLGIRGLFVPALLAHRAGLITELKNDQDQVAITTGAAFSAVSGYMVDLSLHVAFKIADLGKKAKVDPRFFVQPSGSGGAVTGKRTRSTARPARNGSEGKGTAASR